MNPMLLVMIMLGTILFMALGLGASLFFVQRYLNPEPSVIDKRLSQVKAMGHQNSFDPSKQISKYLKSEKEYYNEKLGELLEKYSFVGVLKNKIQTAGIKMPVDHFIILFFAAPVGMGFLLSILMLSPFPLMLFSGLSFGTLFYLNFRIKGRLKTLSTQLPDALTLMTSSLRAGHAFQSSLVVVAKEFKDPIATEFSNVVNDINLGLSVKDSLEKMVERLKAIPDVRMLATAILIQREVGGNLAEVLDKLGHTIRERFKMKGKINAATAQSRLSGMVMGVAPIALLIGLTVLNYQYVAPLYETLLGNILLGVCAVQQIIGFIIISKIMNIRV